MYGKQISYKLYLLKETLDCFKIFKISNENCTNNIHKKEVKSTKQVLVFIGQKKIKKSYKNNQEKKVEISYFR